MNGIAAPGGRTISVFLADDNLIVREGVRALINRSSDLEVTGVAADYDEVVAGCAGGRAAGPGHRHPDAPVVPERGHRRRQGSAQAPPRHRRHRALPVRRPRVRDRAACRGFGRLRLPAQGQSGRGQPARRRDPQRGERRHGPGPDDRRGPAAAGHRSWRAAPGRGGAAGHDRRGQADQGNRGGQEDRRPRRSTPRWRPCFSSSRRASRPDSKVRSSGSGCCIRPSWTGRNRARRCPGCCPAAWPRSSGRSRGRSARPSGSSSPC